jgi:hypothetical protein
MRDPKQQRRNQHTTVYTALLLFNLTLVIVQLWLFVGALEGILSGNVRMAIPAAVFSVLLMLANVWMLVGIVKLEKQD